MLDPNISTPKTNISNRGTDGFTLQYNKVATQEGKKKKAPD